MQCALNLYQIFFNCSVTEYNSTLRTQQQRTRPDQDERRESRLIARLRGRPGPTTRTKPKPSARPRTRGRPEPR